MGQSKKFNLSDLSGGLNQGTNPTDIDDKELQDILNFYPYAKRLALRGGIKRISGAPSQFRYIERTTNAAPYKVSTGVWRLIVGGLTSLGKLNNDALVKLPHADNVTYTSMLEPWSFVQYKDIMYAGREATGTFQRTDGELVGNSGIESPATAPTLAQGGAGNLDAGEYIGVVTFLNLQSGNESNPSDPSNTLTLLPGTRITWNNIPISSNYQVNARRLYRTLVDQQGVYYLVDEIQDNTTTTFDDNVVETELGIDASFDNGLPPPGLKYLAIFQERMFATDGVDLFFSELLLPEAFGEFNFIQVQPDDGHKIAGILPFGNKLIVGKTNKTWIVTGTENFQLEKLGDHGCFSHHSMKASEDFAFWFGGDNFYQSDGNSVRAIGDKKIRTSVDSINLEFANRIVGAVDKKKGWYMALVPLNGSSETNAIMVFNYRDDSWSIFDYSLNDFSRGAPGWIAEFFTVNGTTLIYSNLNGMDNDSVFQLESGLSDDGRNIIARFRTKSYGYDKEDISKIMKNVSIQSTITDAVLSCSLYKDSGVLSNLGVKTVSLAGSGIWKRIPLANAGDPGTSIALQVEYSGQRNVEVLGLSFKIVDLEREVGISTLV